MKKLIVFLVILLSLLAWNYKDKILSFFNQAQTSLVSDTSESNAFETSEFIDKYNVYINFENSFDKRVRESQEYYFKWADREESPPTNTNRVYGIMTLYDHSLEFLEEAIKKKPKIDEVDDLMKDVLKKATTLHNVVKNAHSYYDRQDYKDDDFVKAKKFHKELILAYDNYFISYAKMDPVFSDLQDRFNNFLINKYQESGELIKYNLIKGIKKAKQIIAIIGDLEGEELLKLDLGDFKKAVAEYRDVHNELEKLSTNEAQKAQEFGEHNHANGIISTFIREGNDLIKECRNLTERIENKDFSHSIVHPGIPDDGTPIKIREIYADMIEGFNRIN